MLVRIHIPDRAFAFLAVLLLGLSWVTMLWANHDLPARLPTHFGWSGWPDAWSQKSFITVFSLPLVQTLLTGLLWWAYRHPQYSNIPGVVSLSIILEPERSWILKLIRHLFVVLMVLLNLVFSELTVSLVAISFGVRQRLDPWMMTLLVCLVLLVVTVYTIWLARIAKIGAIRVAAQATTHDER